MSFSHAMPFFRHINKTYISYEVWSYENDNEIITSNWLYRVNKYVQSSRFLGNKSENCRLSLVMKVYTQLTYLRKNNNNSDNDNVNGKKNRRREKKRKSCTLETKIGVRCEWMRVRVTQTRPTCSKSDIMCGRCVARKYAMTK